MKEFEIFPKEWTTHYRGHTILVHNSWNKGMKLFVDGVCSVKTDKLFALSKTTPILNFEVTGEHDPFYIEVYSYAILTVKVKIVIDGQYVAGDAF